MQTRGDKGFSLLEVLVGMAVFMIGMLGVIVLFMSAVRMNAFSGNFSEANSLAVRKIEELRESDYDLVVSGTEAGLGKDGIFTVNRLVTETDNSTLKDLKTIDITVSWTVKESTQSITMRTLRSNYEM